MKKKNQLYTGGRKPKTINALAWIAYRPEESPVKGWGLGTRLLLVWQVKRKLRGQLPDYFLKISVTMTLGGRG